jgi:hypothetical protein
MPEVDSPYPYRDDDEVRLQETLEARGGFICPLCGRPDSRGKAVHDRTTHAGVTQINDPTVELGQAIAAERAFAERSIEAERRTAGEHALALLDLDNPVHANAVAAAITRYNGGRYVPLDERYPWIRPGRPGFEGVRPLQPDEAEHGHRFRIAFTSAMSAGRWNDDRSTVEDWRDADWWGEAREITVRAFDLPTALRLAAAYPLTAWYDDEELIPPTPAAVQYGEGEAINHVRAILSRLVNDVATGTLVDLDVYEGEVRVQIAHEADLRFDGGKPPTDPDPLGLGIRLDQEEARLAAIRSALAELDEYALLGDGAAEFVDRVRVLVGPQTDLAPLDPASAADVVGAFDDDVTEEQRAEYRRLVESGLSDYEARATVFPDEPPAAEDNPNVTEEDA